MSQLQAIRVRVSKSFQAIHKDEQGMNTIEIVLILCAAAVILTVAFKFLWGTTAAPGKAQALLTQVWEQYNTGLSVTASQGSPAPTP